MVLMLFAGVNLFAEEDMSTYLINTQKLAQEGKKEEALKRFIWLYNHSLEQDPNFSPARLSFLLGYWVELGAKYRPALNALRGIRDRETELIKNGKGNFSTFDEIRAINENLQEDEKSIALFEFMDKKYPVLAQSCWRSVASKIIAAKKVGLVEKYEPDLMKRFNEIAKSYKVMVLHYETVNNRYLEALKKCNQDGFVRETLNLITIAEAIKDKKMADQIREKAFEILPDSRLK